MVIVPSIIDKLEYTHKHLGMTSYVNILLCAFVPLCLCAFVPLCLCASVPVSLCYSFSHHSNCTIHSNG